MILAKATQNPMVPLIVEPIFQIMPKIKVLVFQVVNKAKEAALDYHFLIAEAVIANDEKNSIRLMKEHLDVAEEHAMKVAETM